MASISKYGFERLLNTNNTNYDYVYEILCEEIQEGDFKAPDEASEFDPHAKIHQDDIYRVITLNYFDDSYRDEPYFEEKVMVVKVLIIKGVEFQLGLLLRKSFGQIGPILEVGCFDRVMERKGFGMRLD